MDNRVEHIDIAKGITIILVALFHSKLTVLFPETIQSMGLFRLPVFFFLSGIFFHVATDTKTAIWKKADSLLKPYFFTLFALLAISALLQDEHLLWQLKGLLYGNGETIRHKWLPMWFLTHLFVVYCFSYFLLKLTDIKNRHTFYKVGLIILLLIIGIQWIDLFWRIKIVLLTKEIELPGLPFSLDIVFISSAFFLMGTFMKKFIVDFKPNLLLLSASLILFFYIALFTNAYISLNMRSYPEPIFSTIAAICGIYFIIFISFYINKIPLVRNVFFTFGQASLFILMFHLFIGNTAYNYFIQYIPYKIDLESAIYAFLISITAPLLIKIIVSKIKVLSFFYCPVK